MRCAYGGSERKNAVAFVVNERVFVGLGKGYSGKKSSIQEYSSPNYAELLELETACEIYPNPSNGKIQLRSELAVESILIFNESGTLTFEHRLSTPSETMDLSHLSTGIYHVIVKTMNGQTIQKQLLID